jgi:hypothetical protein
MGMIVKAIVCDGAPQNVAAVVHFGVCLKTESPKPSFPHPNDESVQIHVIFDPVHMIKLIRNMLEAYRGIRIPNVGVVRWQHFVELYNAQ